MKAILIGALATVLGFLAEPNLKTQLGTSGWRHAKPVTALKFQRDGNGLCSLALDGILSFWRMDGTEVFQLALGPAFAKAFDLSPNGKTVACVGPNGIVEEFEIGLTKSRQKFGVVGDSWATCVDYSPDGTYLAVGELNVDKGHQAVLWDRNNPKLVKYSPPLAGRINAVAFSRSTQFLAACGQDTNVYVWRLNDLSNPLKLPGHSAEVFSIAFSPDEALLVTCGNDKTRLWDLKSKKIVREWDPKHGAGVAAAFTPDGKKLALSGNPIDYSVRLYDLEKRVEALKISDFQAQVLALAFSPDGSRLASGDGNNAIRLWNPKSGREATRDRAHCGPVRTVSFCPNAECLFSGADDHRIIRWPLREGRDTKAFEFHKGKITNVMVSPDGRLVASAALDQSVILFDTKEERIVFKKVLKSDVHALAFSSGCSYLGFGTRDGTVEVCAIPAGITKFETKYSGGEITTIAFHPQDDRLAVGSRKEIFLLDWQKKRKKTVLKPSGGSDSLRFTPNGEILASASSYDKTLVLWKVDTMTRITTIREKQQGYKAALSFSAHGTMLAYHCNNRTLRVLETKGWKEINVFKLKTGTMDQIEFAPNDDQIAIGCANSTILLIRGRPQR